MNDDVRTVSTPPPGQPVDPPPGSPGYTPGYPPAGYPPLGYGTQPGSAGPPSGNGGPLVRSGPATPGYYGAPLGYGGAAPGHYGAPPAYGGAAPGYYSAQPSYGPPPGYGPYGRPPATARPPATDNRQATANRQAIGPRRARSMAPGPGSGSRQTRDHSAAAPDPERHLQRRGRLRPRQPEGDAGTDRNCGRDHADHHAGLTLLPLTAYGTIGTNRPEDVTLGAIGASWRRWPPPSWSPGWVACCCAECSPSSSGGQCSARRSPSAKRGPRFVGAYLPCSAWRCWKARWGPRCSGWWC